MVNLLSGTQQSITCHKTLECDICLRSDVQFRKSAFCKQQQQKESTLNFAILLHIMFDIAARYLKIQSFSFTSTIQKSPWD